MSQSYEMTGKVKVIGEEQTFGSGFVKRILVLEVLDGKYTQEVPIEFCQGKVSLLDDVSVGQDANVAFNIKGREYNGKWFSGLDGWKISQPSGPTERNDPPSVDAEEDLDIPF